MDPNAKPQPLRLNVQCSFTVKSEEHATELFEKIGVSLKTIAELSTIGGQIMKMLGPCCGEKPHVSSFERNLPKP
jgi:hypothetical protein